MKEKLGNFIFVYLSIAPVFLWIAAKPLNLRFQNFSSTLSSFGQITGLIGMSMFALNFVLATRSKFLEDYFGGMNKVYTSHRIFGSLSFIFILFHPILLALRYVPVSIEGAAYSLFPLGQPIWITSGFISLFALMLFLVLIFYSSLPYNVLKFTHKFIGLSFFFAGLHALFIPSDVSNFFPLKAYFIFLTIAGLSCFLYRSVLEKYLIKKYKYIVGDIVLVNNKTIEVSLVPALESMDHQSGQFVFVSFKSKDISSESHPFSISSGENDKNLRVSIKFLGDYTSKLINLRKGTPAEIEGPFGRFCCSDKNKNKVWIAGGIGITPFLSMARSIENQNCNIDLVYIIKNENDGAHLEELREISKNNSRFRILPYFSQIHGRITASFIRNVCPGFENREIYLCGPPQMMKSLKDQLLSLKIPSGNIFSEEFKML